MLGMRLIADPCLRANAAVPWPFSRASFAGRAKGVVSAAGVQRHLAVIITPTSGSHAHRDTELVGSIVIGAMVQHASVTTPMHACVH